ncbi:MAG: aromatic amino acid transport family protein [Patescibacteria group bacterium]
MKKNYISSVAILLGTIVGAGIFGIPYAISKSGVIPGFFYLLILGGAVLLVHLFFGEVILRTDGKYRLVGYTQKYLGKWSKVLITISIFIGSVGSLLAFSILAGDFLKIIFSSFPAPFSNISTLSFTLVFLASLSFFIFHGIKLIAPVEIVTNIAFFAIIFIIFLLGAPKVDFQNFPLINTDNLFLPYGIILFSVVGWMAIPEVMEVLKGHEEKKNLKKVLIFGSISSVLLYAFFSFVVLGVSGKGTSPEALWGLVPFLGNKIVFFGALAAIITLADSFLITGVSLRNTLVYDFKFSKPMAALITCSLPLVLFLVGFRGFIGTIGFVGTVVGVIDGVIILLMYRCAKKKCDREPEYRMNIHPFLIYLLISIFILGGLIQFFVF